AKGLVYRKFKPVYWSPSSGTALAEAELEYNEEHVSRAAYVRFPVVGEYREVLGLEGLKGRLYAVVWTTTPWTLPANRAIAVHDNLVYHVVRVGDDAVLVADGCLERVAQILRGEGAVPEILAIVSGSRLARLQYTNLLRGEQAAPQPFIHGSFVTADS